VARLSIRLLGVLSVSRDDDPVEDFATDKVRALLAYLAVERDTAHRRERLAGLLWAEHSERSARTNLRRALADLRKAVGDQSANPSFFVADRNTIQLNPAADIWIDTAQFADRLGAATIEDLEAALRLYRGSFLEGFSVGDSPAFEEWVVLERESSKREAVNALEALADHYEPSGDGQAMIYSRRLIELDPWRETAHRRMMRLLASSGGRAAAVAHYESMRRSLANELHVEPEAESTRLLESIKAGDFSPASPPEEAPAAPRPVGVCPYRGLGAFRELDADFFCGRDDFVDRVLLSVKRQPVVAVIIGSSGSGKSSAVFAGLIPRLRRTGDWLIAAFRPGPRPLTALAGAMVGLLEPDLSETDRLVQAQKLATALELGELPLGNAARRALEKDPPTTHLLLVVDQAEELYTLCPDPDMQRRFLDVLLDAVAGDAPHGNHDVVLLVALRADFMGLALAYRPFADTLQDSSLLMGPMSRAELRTAIEQPAARQGAAFEAGLVERLLDDVGHEPGNLPMLEFALTLLWDEQVNGVLTHDGYEQIGRVDGALARYADNVITDLDPAEEARARHVFTQLVRPGEGTEDTRRVASRTELSAADWQLVQFLADKRLVVTGHGVAGEDVVEVVHEALIQHWDQLQAWLETDRAFRTWQEGLRVALREWEAANRDEGALLRGSPLTRAEQWQQERPGELSDSERDYIAAGVRLRDRVSADRERRRNRVTAALAAGLIVAVALVAVALISRANAQREAAVNRSLVLASAAADAFQGGDGDLALALALESVAIEDPPSEAPRTLADVGLGIGTRTVLEGHSHAVSGAALSADGDHALSGSCAEVAPDGTCSNGELILWDVSTGTEIARLEGHTGWVHDVAFGPSGDVALSASDDGTLLVWDITTLEPIRQLTADRAGIRAAAISADGTTALSGSNQGSLTVWNLATGEPIQNITGHDGPITQAIFGPGDVAGSAGPTALTASADSTIVLWDLETGARIRTFTGHAGAVTDVAAHPDGTRILSTGEDLTLRMWDIETATQTHEQGFGFDLASIAITPDGRTAVFSAKTSIYLWDIGRFQEIDQLAGHAVDETQQSSVNAIAISRDGQLALSAGSDGSVRIWNLSGQLVSRYFATGGDDIDAIALSPDGTLLLAGMGKGELANGGLVVWDVQRAEALRRFGDAEIGINPGCVAYHPTAARALACSADPSGATGDTSLVLWDIAAGEEVRRFEGHASLVRAVAFLPDGDRALAGSQSVGGNLVGDLILWDLETGEKIRAYDVTHDIADIAVTSDGGRALTGSVTGAAVILWDIETGDQIRRLQGHNVPVLNVAFGPRDELAFASAVDGRVLAWDVATGEIVRRFESNEAGGFALDVSPDGRFVLYGSAGGALTLWDFDTGEVVQRFVAHSDFVFDVVFHPDGRRAYTAGIGGKLIEWSSFDVTLDELLLWIEDHRYVRDLTCEERTRYHLDPSGCSQQ